jgi:hypothetical protein
MSEKLINYKCNDCQADVSFVSGLGFYFIKSKNYVCRECFGLKQEDDSTRVIEACQISNVGFDTPNPCRSK